jgi:hypothetical protein
MALGDSVLDATVADERAGLCRQKTGQVLVRTRPRLGVPKVQ